MLDFNGCKLGSDEECCNNIVSLCVYSAVKAVVISKHFFNNDDNIFAAIKTLLQRCKQ